MEEIKRKLRSAVLASFDYSTEITEKALLAEIDRVICKEAKDTFLTLEKKEWLRKEIYHSIRGLDILEELLQDDLVTEIMVNGADQIFYEKEGKLVHWQRTIESSEKLMDMVQQIVAGANRRVNAANPIVDARLPDGSRVNIILPPVALNGPIVTIRKFGKEPLTMKRLMEIGAITEEAAAFLGMLVQARYNIFISGGTGSGKSTFLNALTEFIPHKERVITIEDAAELKVRGVENLVTLEARKQTSEECQEISIRDLIRAALRMRPDRIIVGEVRGEEAIDMLQAMNTGHDGSLSTGHANSPEDMISRLETMVLLGTDIPLAAVKMQIASAIDILVHLGRLRDGSRKVLEIDEVVGMESGEIRLEPLYRFEEEREEDGKIVGEMKKCQTELKNKRKLAYAGLLKKKVKDEENTKDPTGVGKIASVDSCDNLAVL